MGNTPGPDLLLDWDIAGESPAPPRFSPASPLPPEVEEWMAANTQEARPQTLPQYKPAQPEPFLIFVQPPASKSDQDLGPLDEPENAASPSSEATSSHADNGQFLTSEENNAVLPQAGAAQPILFQAENFIPLLEATVPKPELFQAENQASLPEGGALAPVLPRPEHHAILPVPPNELDRQTGGNVAGKSVQPSRRSPAAPPTPEHGQRAARRGRWKTTIIFCVVTGLLILAGGHFLGSLMGLNSLQPGSNSSSINNAIDEQAIATAESTNTNPYVSGGTLVFSDTFNSASPNWDQHTGCAFTDGDYRVTTTSFQTCALNRHLPLADFVLEVNVTLLRGDVGGFFFRATKHAHKTHAYLLDFDSKGSYQIWNYGASMSPKLLAQGVSNDLNAGYNRMNTIALVAQGPNITLYINGHKVRHLTDTTYSKGGLSLISSEYAHHTGISQAAYKDLRLWQL